LTEWWINVVIPGIEATRNPDAPLAIGEHCRFCPNKGHCPALKSEVFEFPMGIDATHLSDEELGAILDKLKAIAAVEETFKSEALRRARQGAKVAGYKLVRKKSNRVFKESMAIPSEDNPDEFNEVKFVDAVLERFGTEAYTDPQVKSPPQLEKLEGGQEFVSMWSYKPDAGLTLAPYTDKRSEVKPNIERLRTVKNA
jgi:hypothetical protein